MALDDLSDVSIDIVTGKNVLRKLNGLTMGVPDLLLQIADGNSHPRPLWVMEVASSQNDDEATNKMQGQVDGQPDIIACSLISIKETTKFSSPSYDSTIASTLRDDHLPSITEVVSDNHHAWLNPLHVSISTWIRPSDSPFNLNDNLESAACVVVVSRHVCFITFFLNFTTSTGTCS